MNENLKNHLTPTTVNNENRRATRVLKTITTTSGLTIQLVTYYPQINNTSSKSCLTFHNLIANNYKVNSETRVILLYYYIL